MTDYEHDVWATTLDNRWICRVITDERAPYKGRLIMREATTGELLVDETVDVAYAARYGPDAADLVAWQDRCRDVADRRVTDGAWKVDEDPWLTPGD